MKRRRGGSGKFFRPGCFRNERCAVAITPVKIMMPEKKSRLSATVITKNEAHNIRDCLASVAWADEIIIVDAESTDDTVARCEAFIASLPAEQRPALKIFVRPWPGFAAQKQFALEKAGHEWVLSLDADERVTPELQSEIQNLLQQPDGPAGYYIPRLSSFLGRFMRHSGWYPGYQLRLFRKQLARLSSARVHEGFIIEGRCGHLKNNLLHLTHRTLEESFARMNRYSSLEAQDRAARGERARWWDFFVHPFSAFWSRYVYHQGFRDGVHGLLLALVTATVKMALYMKLWELQQERDRAGS